MSILDRTFREMYHRCKAKHFTIGHMTEAEIEEVDRLCKACAYNVVCCCVPDEFDVPEDDLQIRPVDKVVDDEITLEKIVDGNFTVYGNVFLNGATCINNYGGENGRD